MQILVTGGAGYIGSHTAHQLVAAGHSVVVLDNLHSGHEWAVPKQAVFIRGDVCDSPLVRSIFRDKRIEAVVHFAAYLEVSESVAHPLKYYRNNVAATMSLVEDCNEFGVHKFIFSSTAAVYGNASALPISEDAPVDPLNPYGRSKLMSEWILRDLSNTGNFRYVALRYFNVAGAHAEALNGQSTPNASHLIKVACEAASGKRVGVEIYGTDYPTPDGTGIRDYIHVEDLASAHVLALEYLRNGGKSDIFNCGYGHGFTVRQVIDAIKRVSGQDFKIEEAPRRLGDSSAVVADSTKIRTLMGWRPKYDDLDLICRHAYAWEKKGARL